MNAIEIKKERIRRLQSLASQGIHTVEPTIVALQSEVETDEASGRPYTFSGVTITPERMMFTHNLNRIPRNVTFYAEGQPQNFNWSRDDGGGDCDPLNKLVIYNSAEELIGVEINIFY